MGIWIVCGRVLDGDTNAPVSGVTVQAFDADRRGRDDQLGQGTTNTLGQFCINYRISDFVDIFPLEDFFDDAPLPFTGAGPDVYFRVETSGGIQLLDEPSSDGRRPDRENVGPCFCVDLFVRECGKLYVAGSDSVTVVDIESNTIVDTITVGGSPSEVALTPDGSLAYVSNGDLNDVSVIDTATRTVVATVPMGGVSRSLAMAPDGAHCYVCGGAVGSSCLWVIDTATNAVSTTIPLESDGYEGYPWDVVITPDGAKVYVTLYPNHVLAVDTASNAVISGVGVYEPYDLEVSMDGTRLYATENYSEVCVIDTATDSQINSFETGGEGGLRCIGITPDGTRAYASDFDFISVVDIATETVITTLPYGHCGDVEVTPGGSRAYVSTGSELLAIDTATNTIAATVPGVHGDITIAH
jgi:YVTN family beta-propeller protein